MESIDMYGYQALERMAEAPRFNHWMYETIGPFLNGKILEIGSGIGNLSAYFIKDGKNISLSDYDENYVNFLKKRYHEKSDSEIFHLDLSTKNFTKKYYHLVDTYDAVFLLNVLEHIEDDKAAIINCAYLLKPGGILLVLVPAYSILFSKMDKLLGHYRRYTLCSLKQTLDTSILLKVEKGFYFNLLGICGWSWNKIFCQAEISKSKISLFNNLVPFAKLVDNLFFRSIGLSVIAIAKKK
jgi:2-polyprenyl-3-methyl-5-hydroxy-6-metoxy-1,4-benzoquinol methylase